jgi:hypothetical protein
MELQIGIHRRLQGVAVVIVKGIVQEKDEAHFQADLEQLAAELGERMRTQTPAQKTAKVLAAQIDFHRARPVQGVGEIANRAELVADGTAAIFGASDERIGFAHGQGFQAMRTEGLAGNVVPGALPGAAAAARVQGQHIVRRSKSHAGHSWVPC